HERQFRAVRFGFGLLQERVSFAGVVKRERNPGQGSGAVSSPSEICDRREIADSWNSRNAYVPTVVCTGAGDEQFRQVIDFGGANVREARFFGCIGGEDIRSPGESSRDDLIGAIGQGRRQSSIRNVGDLYFGPRRYAHGR